MATRHIAGFDALVLGPGVAASAILGPLGLGVIRFRTPPNMESQFVGGEIVSLIVVALLANMAGGLWLRRGCSHRR